MKGYGTLMFFLLAGVILLAFTGRVDADTCTLKKKSGGLEAVIENGDHFMSGRHTWMICNSSGTKEEEKIKWFCDALENDNPASIVLRRLSWSDEVSNITVCKTKVQEKKENLEQEAAKLRKMIDEEENEHKRLRAESEEADQSKQECWKKVGIVTKEDGKIWNLTNESAWLDTLMEKETRECENGKYEAMEEYECKLERMDKEIRNVNRTLELKKQQLEMLKLNIKECPTCDAGTCWDDVKIKENLDKLYGKDGWMNTGSNVKCYPKVFREIIKNVTEACKNLWK
ncbi:T. brucei spp.-specific protein [Trypanosoma brucei gambiense DAL972]|uniref:T. brucei spp.-specific protein n=1 Tax=Trypanosoma brucei gambiense (strain MHOM/CI/86/DAL972) TaxID=679716 RepID=C9ZY58_TRYB9|nr:T. brucei spp.-specific protein [Trypanosoma brucei gambiense DAL972]CBH14357.1 T. brucei spp.-specific protein [Trypanosoma brucei gambiense DAL972]|eukprot:XP_011776623.1 T. brucei spp.-specific protein [Trypanosoma brucei gambiense DAL972]